jgi:glycosyltransferase involved in cell wall biosynthesis
MMIMDISNKITHSNIEYRFSVAGKFDPNNPLSISDEDLMLLKNSKNINFLGEVSNNKIHDLYFKHDIFLLPSIREGIPGAALEAASTGMPLLLSNVPGCEECISLADSNGALFEVNSLDSLENAIVTLCRKKENLIKCSFNSRKHIEDHFSVQKISKEYLKIIRKN